jgi:hypothetical protein
MAATDKRSLISKSVMAIQIGVHLVGEEPDRHILRVAPGVSHMKTFYEVPTKSKSGICSRDEVLAPSDAQPGRHPRLPHSPSNKVVPGLLGLLSHIKPDKWSLQIKACHRGQTARSLIDTGGDHHLGTLE